MFPLYFNACTIIWEVGTKIYGKSSVLQHYLYCLWGALNALISFTFSALTLLHHCVSLCQEAWANIAKSRCAVLADSYSEYYFNGVHIVASSYFPYKISVYFSIVLFIL